MSFPARAYSKELQLNGRTVKTHRKIRVGRLDAEAISVSPNRNCTCTAFSRCGHLDSYQFDNRPAFAYERDRFKTFHREPPGRLKSFSRNRAHRRIAP